MLRPNEKVTGPLHCLRLSTSVVNFIILVLTAIIAELETSKKALAKERSARLVADRSLAEQNAAQQSANQSLRASEEAKAALNKDLLSTHASLTATEEKLSSKSSAFDCVVIMEREVQIKLEATEEKMKA
jgi:hypothetical protein